MTTSTIISGKNIKKKYQDLSVLDIDHVDIFSNQITTIVGPSGAGKSTLLHILGTLLKPNQGELFIANNEISTYNDNQLADLRNQFLGFVFQSHHLLPEFNALENVCLPAMIGNQDKKIYTQRAEELLEFVGLKDRMIHKPSQMSGGEQQRVSIARALINQPKMVFADEPTGNLDTKNAVDIHELFLKLTSEFGYSFLIVTHNMDLAKLSHRVLEMKDGKIIH